MPCLPSAIRKTQDPMELPFHMDTNERGREIFQLKYSPSRCPNPIIPPIPELVEG